MEKTVSIQELMQEVHKPDFNIENALRDINCFADSMSSFKYTPSYIENYDKSMAILSIAVKANKIQIDCSRNDYSEISQADKTRKQVCKGVEKLFKDYKDLVHNYDFPVEISEFKDMVNNWASQARESYRENNPSYYLTSSDTAEINNFINKPIDQSQNVIKEMREIESKIGAVGNWLQDKQLLETKDVASDYLSNLEAMDGLSEEKLITFMNDFKHDINDSLCKEKAYSTITLTYIQSRLANPPINVKINVKDTANELVQFMNEVAVMEQRAGAGIFVKDANRILQENGVIDNNGVISESIPMTNIHKATAEIIKSYKECAHFMSIYPVDYREFKNELRNPSVDKTPIYQAQSYQAQSQTQNQPYNQNKNKNDIEI